MMYLGLIVTKPRMSPNISQLWTVESDVRFFHVWNKSPEKKKHKFGTLSRGGTTSSLENCPEYIVLDTWKETIAIGQYLMFSSNSESGGPLLPDCPTNVSFFLNWSRHLRWISIISYIINKYISHLSQQFLPILDKFLIFRENDF